MPETESMQPTTYCAAENEEELLRGILYDAGLWMNAQMAGRHHSEVFPVAVYISLGRRHNTMRCQNITQTCTSHLMCASAMQHVQCPGQAPMRHSLAFMAMSIYLLLRPSFALDCAIATVGFL